MQCVRVCVHVAVRCEKKKKTGHRQQMCFESHERKNGGNLEV